MTERFTTLTTSTVGVVNACATHEPRRPLQMMTQKVIETVFLTLSALLGLWIVLGPRLAARVVGGRTQGASVALLVFFRVSGAMLFVGSLMRLVRIWVFGGSFHR
jgi:hypothetical protein